MPSLQWMFFPAVYTLMVAKKWIDEEIIAINWDQSIDCKGEKSLGQETNICNTSQLIGTLLNMKTSSLMSASFFTC